MRPADWPSDDDPITASGGPVARRWRRVSWIAPTVVVAMGAYAVSYPSFSGVVLAALIVSALGLLGWAAWLSAERRYEQPRLRFQYTTVLMELVALFGGIVVWRARGGGLTAGIVILGFLLAAAGISYLLRRRLYPIWSAQPGALTWLTGGALAALATAAAVAVRSDPIWFARYLLLPAMLVVAALAPPFWAGVEEAERG